MRRAGCFFEQRLKTALGLGDEAVFVGQGHKFQIWEPTRFPGPSRTGAGAGPTLARGARRALRRRGRRDEPRPRLRRTGHVPVLLKEAMEALDPRAGRPLFRWDIRGRRLFARASRARRARDRARSRSRGGSRPATAPQGFVQRAARACGSALLAISTKSPSAWALRRSTGSRSTSACRRWQLDEASRRLFAAFRRAPRYAHGKQRSLGRRHPARRGRGDDRRHPLLLWRRARRAPDRAAPSSPTAARKPFTSTLELAGLIARVAPTRAGRADPSGDARLPGAAHRRQRRAWRACARAMRGRAVAENPAGGSQL